MARTLAYARNRWLAPDLGRWLQADPNASALVLIGSGAHGGRELGALVAALDLSSLTGDGVNLYEYLGGNPARRFDALGLSWLGVASQAVGALNVFGISLLRGALAEVVYTYAANMEADLDWASDWSLGDDDHSRTSNTWLGEAFRDGASRGFWDAVEYYVPTGEAEEGEAPAYARTVWHTIRKITKAGAKIFRSGAGHHAFPVWIAQALGRKSAVLARLPQSLHNVYHGGLDRVLAPLGVHRGMGVEGVRKFIKKGTPGWKGRQKRLIKVISDYTKQFEKNHKITGLHAAFKKGLKLGDDE